MEAFSDGHLVKHTMFVPRELVAEAIPDLASVIAEPLPDSVNLRLLRSWFGHRDLAAGHGRRDGDRQRMAVELLRVAVWRVRGGGGGTQEEEVLLLRVKDFLDRNLTEPG